MTRSRVLAKMAIARGTVTTRGRDAFMRVIGGFAYRAHSKGMAYDAGSS